MAQPTRAARSRLTLVDLRHPETPAVLPVDEVLELGAPGVETHVPSDNYDAVLYLDSSPMAKRL